MAEYEQIKGELCGRIWRFARYEEDGTTNGYITLGLVPYWSSEDLRNGMTSTWDEYIIGGSVALIWRDIKNR